MSDLSGGADPFGVDPTAPMTAEPVLPSKALRRRHVGKIHRLRPSLAIVMPFFPWAVTYGKMYRSFAWTAYGWPLAAAGFGLAYTAVVCAAMLAGVFGVAAVGVFWLSLILPMVWFVPKSSSAPKIWIGTALSALLVIVLASLRLGWLGWALLGWVCLICLVGDFVAGAKEDLWYLRRMAASTRRRHPMMWSIIAGKSLRVQSFAGGGEGDTPFENVGGGRREFDHPAMDQIPDLDPVHMTATWRIFIGPGRDMKALDDAKIAMGAQDEHIRNIDIVNEHPMSTYGALVVEYHGRGA